LGNVSEMTYFVSSGTSIN